MTALSTPRTDSERRAVCNTLRSLQASGRIKEMEKVEKSTGIRYQP